MKVFSFDPEERSGDYAEQGWVHVPGGATAEFCDFVRGLIAQDESGPLHGRGIGGAKEQLLLDLPPAVDLRVDILDPIARLTGLDPDRLTISERHVKMYSPDAEAFPRPHKDRFASEVSLGISIEVPEGSHLVLYPDRDVEVNPLLRAGLVESLPDERKPERVLRGAREQILYDAPGDVVAFRGSAIWHLRRHSATTKIVYLKCNEFGSDPLGEDPRTRVRREQSAELLADDDGILDTVPSISANFECATREYSRDLSMQWLNVSLWDQPSFMISEFEFELLQRANAGCSARALVEQLSPDPAGHRSALDAIRRLCERGALILLPADPTTAWPAPAGG